MSFVGIGLPWLLMSNIPTQVRAVIDVDLPRPRQLSDFVEAYLKRASRA